MELNELGEFGLIDLIKEDTINNADSVVIGIGDDAAAFVPASNKLQLITTDMLVEDVHFNLNTISAWQLGYKAIAVNISDIAAMGGIPRHVVISLAISKGLSVNFITELYKGMKDICYEYGVNIVGGDTVSSPKGLIINVSITGEVEPAKVQKRSGAKVGDVIAVTGMLGNSAAGLELLMKGNWEGYQFADSLIISHLTPRPQVQAGQKLAALGTNSMNDISDGLASEVNEIAKASKVGMIIYEQSIPLSKDLKAATVILDKPLTHYALYGGEDYQLVFTMSHDKLEIIKTADVGADITVIGEVVDASQGVTLINNDGSKEALKPKGYNHFK